MNEFETYEYVIAQKKTNKVRIFRAFLVTAYVLFVAVMLLLAAATPLGAALVALMPFGLALLVFLTWQYTSVEFEVSITSGEVTVSRIFGGRSRQIMTEFRLRDCVMIAPAHDRSTAEKADLFRPQTRISALSEPNAPDAYLAAYETQDGHRGVLLFEATQKALRVCHFYNAAATTLTKVSK